MPSLMGCPGLRVPNAGMLYALIVSLVTTSSHVALGASFLDAGHLLKVACSSKPSPADSFFRWMLLLSSHSHLPQAMVAAVKKMSCRYEVRTIESLQQWNTSEIMSYVDYKIIALEVPIGNLRQALQIYVSSSLLLNLS